MYVKDGILYAEYKNVWSETFFNEAAELIESFSCGRRWLIFSLHTLHAGQVLVKSHHLTSDTFL